MLGTETRRGKFPIFCMHAARVTREAGRAETFGGNLVCLQRTWHQPTGDRALRLVINAVACLHHSSYRLSYLGWFESRMTAAAVAVKVGDAIHALLQQGDGSLYSCNSSGAGCKSPVCSKGNTENCRTRPQRGDVTKMTCRAGLKALAGGSGPASAPGAAGLCSAGQRRLY
jgi:hypothetical protein